MAAPAGLSVRTFACAQVTDRSRTFSYRQRAQPTGTWGRIKRNWKGKIQQPPETGRRSNVAAYVERCCSGGNFQASTSVALERSICVCVYMRECVRACVCFFKDRLKQNATVCEAYDQMLPFVPIAFSSKLNCRSKHVQVGVGVGLPILS